MLLLAQYFTLSLLVFVNTNLCTIFSATDRNDRVYPVLSFTNGTAMNVYCIFFVSIFMQLGLDLLVIGCSFDNSFAKCLSQLEFSITKYFGGCLMK